MQQARAVRIRHLYISPGHNYFGHHGKEPSEHPTVAVPEVHCVAGRGIEGDRFFGWKQNYRGEVTFFAIEAYDALCARLDVWNRPPSVLRRNVVMEGADLNAWIGQEFELQGVRFLGTEEARPCFWMERAFAPGAEAALKGHGGLRAKVLTGGVLRVKGDE